MAKLFDANGIEASQEYLVTYQVIFRVRGKNQEHVSKMVDSGVSFRGSLAPLLVGIGIQATPATAEAFAELGIDPSNMVKS